jgi:hypothetical protein
VRKKEEEEEEEELTHQLKSIIHKSVICLLAQSSKDIDCSGAT